MDTYPQFNCKLGDNNWTQEKVTLCVDNLSELNIFVGLKYQTLKHICVCVCVSVGGCDRCDLKILLIAEHTPSSLFYNETIKTNSVVN